MTNTEENIRYDIITSEEVSDTELNQWRSLPVSIRDDPCFAAYQKEYLKGNGK